FKVDSEYSHLLEADITKYRDLIQKFETDTLTVDEEKELLDLDMKLDKTTPMLSDTIYLKFKELQDRIRSD
ncbi:MAG: hypothetical protein U9N49_07730, partial [Campylobacterota bacterium]|nr:hypothetical protein [Campylobacterota bacterium]